VAKRARLSARQVNRILVKLQRQGEIIIERPGGRGRVQNYANVYRVLLPPSGRSDKMSSPSDISCSKDVKNVRATVKEPSVIHSAGSARAFSAARFSQAALGAMIGRTKAELEEILHPGGCAGKVMPSDQRKLRRMNSLVLRLSELKAEDRRREDER
jgi:hypothetical protein